MNKFIKDKINETEIIHNIPMKKLKLIFKIKIGKDEKNNNI